VPSRVEEEAPAGTRRAGAGDGTVGVGFAGAAGWCAG
jgi:hypothetical protein